MKLPPHLLSHRQATYWTTPHGFRKVSRSNSLNFSNFQHLQVKRGEEETAALREKLATAEEEGGQLRAQAALRSAILSSYTSIIGDTSLV